MIEIPNMLMIGGSSRNIGKTTLACKLINKYSSLYSVIGLKVTSIYPGDEQFHGKKDQTLTGDFSILEEKDRSGLKDTSKMLLAGAIKAYYLRAKDQFINRALLKLNKLLVNQRHIIIVESTSLRRFIKPDLFILIHKKNNHIIKQSIKFIENLADKVIIFDGKNYDFQVENIIYTNKGWSIL